MKPEDVRTGFAHLEDIGRLFGENWTFFTGMVEGINEKMSIDILGYLKGPCTSEVMCAEDLIRGILESRTVDTDGIKAEFTNKKMAETVRKYLMKTVE